MVDRRGTPRERRWSGTALLAGRDTLYLVMALRAEVWKKTGWMRSRIVVGRFVCFCVGSLTRRAKEGWSEILLRAYIQTNHV